jgi:hypothetical protein
MKKVILCATVLAAGAHMFASEDHTAKNMDFSNFPVGTVGAIASVIRTGSKELYKKKPSSKELLKKKPEEQLVRVMVQPPTAPIAIPKKTEDKKDQSSLSMHETSSSAGISPYMFPGQNGLLEYYNYKKPIDPYSPEMGYRFGYGPQ